MTWSEIGLWFITSFVGAGIVKLIDLAASRYSERRARTESKKAALLNHIEEFGELAQLYQFFANVSSSIVKDESGRIKRDTTGKIVVENKILEPEPRFEDAIKALKGTDINSAIAQKIAAIRLSSSDVLDIALELDPSGELQKEFGTLYAKTVWSIEIILKDRDSKSPGEKFNDIVEALKDADKIRRSLRARVKQFHQ